MSYARKETRRTKSISITETNRQEQLFSVHENSLFQSNSVFKLLVVILFTVKIWGFCSSHVLRLLHSAVADCFMQDNVASFFVLQKARILVQWKVY